MLQKYGYELEYVDRADMKNYAQSESYFQGSLDKQAFHFHPLNYCLGLGQTIAQHGGQIFENSAVLDMQLDLSEKIITTANGKTVKAQHVVLCGGGYTDKAYSKVQKTILPVATYVITTEKIGDDLSDIVKTQAAIIDDRMASDYYRIVDEDRLLWGGRITAKTAEPERLAHLIKADMLNVYPQLADVKIDFAWTGLMAYARHRMPYIGELSEGVWNCTAFGGHGMNTAPIGGRLIAEAIAQNSQRHEIFKAFKPQWNGGLFGPMAAQATYKAMKIADFWRESRSR